MNTNCDGGASELGFYDGNVQYPFASIEDGSIISISTITNETRRLHKYTCPGCNEEFLPRLGEKRAHCFYHKTTSRCNLDKYIHETAKNLLKQKFDNEEKFEVNMEIHKECAKYQDCLFKTSGCHTSIRRTIDLKQHFMECLLEKKYGGFIPDLLLIPKDENKEPIFIEIWNKHKNSDKKANSPHKIIEIKVQSLEELEELPKHPITESEHVTFSHFDIKKIKPEDMEHHPKLIRFILYEKGTSYCGESKDMCYSYGVITQKTAAFVLIAREDDFSGHSQDVSPKVEMREYALCRARIKGYEPMSCYECKYHKRRKQEENTIFSKQLLCHKDRFTTGEIVECNQEDAISCERFTPWEYENADILWPHRQIPVAIIEKEPRTTEEEQLYLNIEYIK